MDQTKRGFNSTGERFFERSSIHEDVGLLGPGIYDPMKNFT